MHFQWSNIIDKIKFIYEKYIKERSPGTGLKKLESLSVMIFIPMSLQEKSA